MSGRAGARHSKGAFVFPLNFVCILWSLQRSEKSNETDGGIKAALYAMWKVEGQKKSE